MTPNIKVIKKNIRGWISPNLDEEAIALDIQEQENQGWFLISSYGVSLSGKGVDTLVFIYHKK